ncbi:hypothetical protein CRN84_20420 [Budvicia aquatica]|uniref:Uncharacterized protein n=1 Tax=Budvicia aquatica TaxID=82979 RepID=A0A2C6DT71_9GAMM|nr:hypothetical protein CRN84_20420 [Budvicia aquatica]
MLAVPALWLASCDNQRDLNTVRSQPLPASVAIPSSQASPKGQAAMTWGDVLDKRPACDKTTWSQRENSDKTGSAGGKTTTVEYRCDLSTKETQALFTSQWAAWVERHQGRLADSEQFKQSLLDKKIHQQAQQTLPTARWVFEQLQASGDLAHYKALVKDSPAHHLRLDAVNAFFDSQEGRTYLTTTQATKKQVAEAQAALKAVTQVVTASGLATDTDNIDVCEAPVLFVLAVILTPEEVERGLTECEVGGQARHEADIVYAQSQIDVARVMLDKLKQPVSLVNATEVITWGVSAEGIPEVSTHTLELSVKEGETVRQVDKTMGVADSDLAAVLDGTVNRAHQDALVSTMGELVR